MKKLLSFIICIAILIPAAASNVSAVEYSSTCGEGVTWEFNPENGHLLIRGNGEMTWSPWLENFSGSIKTAVIGNGVTNIWYGAFYRCTALETVNIPNSVTSIGDGAFAWCSSLDNVWIPQSVKTIGNDAFYDCSSLSSVDLHNGLETIGDMAFYMCTSLEAIYIPGSVREIGWAAFSVCTELKNVTLSEGLKTIGKSAFFQCEKLVHINIPDSVEEYGDWVFGSCASLFCTKSGNGRYIGSRTNPYAVLISIDDTSASSFAFDPRTRFIESCAFEDCVNFTSFTLPSYIKFAGEGILTHTPALSGIEVEEGSERYKAEGNCLIDTKLDRIIAGCKDSVIPADGSVSRIGKYSFSNCTTLGSLVISDCITEIEDMAFYCCVSLSQITIPNSVTAIRWGAFWYCNGLEYVDFIGSETEWDAIEIGDYNDELLSATVRFAVQFELGDVNGDGSVDIKDILFLRRYIAGLEEFSAEIDARADLNRDNSVDLKDVLMLRRVQAGLE